MIVNQKKLVINYVRNRKQEKLAMKNIRNKLNKI